MLIERPRDTPLGLPSPEALRAATEAARRHYVLPETVQHPAVRAETMQLAYLLQAYGLAPPPAKPGDHRTGTPQETASPGGASPTLFRSPRPQPRRLRQNEPTRELLGVD